MLRKITIKTRLILMFAFLMAALLAVAYSDITGRLDQIKDTELLKKNYIDHLEMLAEVNVTTGNLFLSYRNYYLEYPDAEKMEVRLTDIHNRSDFILTHMQDYEAFLKGINAPQGDLENVANAIATVQNEVLPFNQQLIGLMQSEQIDAVHALIISKELRALRSGLQDELITKIYNDCLNNAVTVLDHNIADMNNANIRMIILVAAGLLFVFTFSILVIRSVVTPIHNLVLASQEISLGNVRVNLPPVAKDEIGELTAQFGNITTVLNTLMQEMAETAYQHNAGDMDARVDESHFKGAYQEVAAGINQMVGSYTQHVLDLLGCLNQFGDGNFNVSYAPLPGKKAALNAAVEDLRKNLMAVSHAIDGLAHNARQGQLSMRADADSFRGDWKELLIGLNLLMDSIIAPINEASAVLQQVAEGNFKQKVEGHYQGDFSLMTNAINNTVTNVASYIHEIARVMTALSNDDLTQHITRPYLGEFTAIKDAFNHITDKFNRILGDILSAAEQVASGARQISESSLLLAQGATQQASAVEELNATILTISESTSHNFDNAKSAETLSGLSKGNALQGDQDMKAMLVSMEGINDASGNIAKIIKTIDDIAFQTNLLALNAAVEAARAGEHGKGFAVVAEEVRSLAGRSQDAAKETEKLIEKSIQSVDEGTKVADTTATALRTIVDDTAKVSEIITNIAQDSEKQVEAIGQVSFGISQITEVVQSNSAASEETASASEELSSQAEILRSLVSVFKFK